MRRSIAIMLFLLLVLPALAQDEPAPHKPDYGAALQRNLVPVEFTFVDAAGAPVVLNGNARPSRFSVRVTRFEGEHNWPVEAWVDAPTGIRGGAPHQPGLEPGQYELEAVLGYYGKVGHKFTVADKPVRETLRIGTTRKTVAVRFVDDAGNPLPGIPKAPWFEWDAPGLPVRAPVLPSKVLRLPPDRYAIGLGGGRGGGGGFAHRRAKGGKVILDKSDDGRFYVNVFTGTEGTIYVPLSEKWFGKMVTEIEGPFDKDEYSVTVEPTDAWRNLDFDNNVTYRNADDPGYKKAAEQQPKPSESWKAAHKIKFELPPTVSAWLRYVSADYNKRFAAPLRVNGYWLEFDAFPETLSTVRLRSSNRTGMFPSTFDAEAFSRTCRNSAMPEFGIRTDGTATVSGTFARVIDANGTPARFVEASVIPLAEDQTAQDMKELEVQLAAKGNRPPNPINLDADVQSSLRQAADEDDEQMVRKALGSSVYANLQKREYRLRYAKYGAWYDSHHRMDGDEDGYVIAPHVVLEKGERYVLYIWGPSRDDLKPDLRLVVRGEGDTTDFGVIRLPK